MKKFRLSLGMYDEEEEIKGFTIEFLEQADPGKLKPIVMLKNVQKDFDGKVELPVGYYGNLEKLLASLEGKFDSEKAGRFVQKLTMIVGLLKL